MGFSVSGSMVIIAIGLLIGFSIAFGVVDDNVAQMTDANAGRSDEILDRHNTEINITNLSYNATADQLTIRVENTGTTTQSVDGTTVLLDGRLHEPVSTEIAGDGTTELWLPGETMNLTIADLPTEPGRVHVIVENGVTSGREVQNGG